MSVTTAPLAATTAPTTSLLTRGLAATCIASAATTTVAAAGRLAGISLDVSGAPVPVLGFAVLTAVFSVAGLVLALVLRRATRRPWAMFVRTTVVLTALSLVPDALADASVATTLLLMLTHLVAAVIVIPVVARRLPAGTN